MTKKANTVERNIRQLERIRIKMLKQKKDDVLKAVVDELTDEKKNLAHVRNAIYHLEQIK